MIALDLRLFVQRASLLALLSLAACGGAVGAASEAKAPDSGEAEPSSVEEAQARIARAREALVTSERAGATVATPPSSPSMRPGGGAEARPSTSPPPAEAPASKTSEHDAARELRYEDRCASPCRALSSMRRAVTALCRMAGDADPRCTDARRTLVESEGRVSPCSC